MEKDWKDDVGSFLSTKGVVRLKYLNNNLEKCIREWTAYLNEFEQVNATYSHDYVFTDEYRQALMLQVRVIVKSLDLSTPFRLYIIFRESEKKAGSCLYIRYTTALKGVAERVWKFADDGTRQLRDDNDEGHYFWEEEEIAEEGFTEEGYVLQTMNNLLKRYFSGF